MNIGFSNCKNSKLSEKNVKTNQERYYHMEQKKNKGRDSQRERGEDESV